MDYPFTQAIIDHVLSGLRQNEARLDGIEARITEAIEKLPVDKRVGLTVESVFVSTVAGVNLSGELATMVRNPAFKIEPTISQLRRAEAAYIEAHDAYLKNRASSSAIEEMRWAFHRLSIARACFDGIIKSLPPSKRGTITERHVAVKSIASEHLRLVAFSAVEQRAIRLIYTDRDTAIERIDQIIATGEASRDLRILHAYLIDPVCREKVEQWLVRELDAARNTASILPAQELGTHPLPVPAPEHIPPNAAATDPAIDADVNDVAIQMLEGWLGKYPTILTDFVKVGDRWRFKGQIRAQGYASAYAQVGDHPRFQAMIDRLKDAVI
ncbi:hypothetical protein [Sphingomonas echinoides]|uniref:Uncharacterized protein n=1 Tax=Sphingomonas echinoides TaxID=59803 RepID=A0ABU4PLN7_9SPHN|nr:hypothetical protein [Sphingomonas echinoides]MDX5985071.1 hypothetical protein [Sphingomonas echinoides]